MKKYTHNVDYDMVNIIGEGNFIYFIIAIETIKKHIFNKF